MQYKQSNDSGFSLIELLLVMTLMVILAMIAIPLFQSYMHQAMVSQVQQEMLRLAILLDRHKAKNFSYRGFSPSSVAIPAHVTPQQYQYHLTVVDGDQVNLKLTDDQALGQSWAIRAQPVQQNDPALLMTSYGIRCKNNNVMHVDFKSCGNIGQEAW